MFKIVAEFSDADLQALIESDSNAWFSSLMEVYRQKGKLAVDRARAKTKDDGGFGNITWNLRGSIGMCIVQQGQIIETYFPPIGKGDEGTKIGTETAQRLATYGAGKDDIVMYIVAGMNYASFVQSVDRDVIKGSTLIFEEEVKALFK
jgi:hypothetical protein